MTQPDPELQDPFRGAESCLRYGDFASATGVAWAVVTRTLGGVRNQFLDFREPRWHGIGWTTDSKQSMIFQLLAKMAGVEDPDTAVEIELLLQQQMEADLGIGEISREFAEDAIARAKYITTKIRALEKC